MTTTPSADNVVLRRARTSDIKGIRSLVAPLAERRVLVSKEAVTYYESVQEFVVAEQTGIVEMLGRRDFRLRDLVSPSATASSSAAGPCMSCGRTSRRSARSL